MTIKELYIKIKGMRPERSTFGRAVVGYALEMLENVLDGNYSDVSATSDVSELEVSHLLNHCEGEIPMHRKWSSEEWGKISRLCSDASYGGNFLIYDDDLLENLYPPSKRTASARNNCLEKQASALRKAIVLIHNRIRFARV